ncbi:MAG: hypothetical protein IPI88_06095 [Chitinophagaceae bacterium]|nr:hypothetical protein [Chitinophagaceae bacterium]
MKIAFIVLLFLHGFIHVLGFAKAFNFGNITQLTKAISRPLGLIWLLAFLLFIMAAIQFLLNNEMWWLTAVNALAISQYLIFTNWHDAKFGTIANMIILAIAIIGYSTWHFSNTYKTAVQAFLPQTVFNTDSLLTEKDLQHLPEPVKKYIRYAGAVGKPKVKNFKLEFNGQIRADEKSAWMPFTSVQYNFVDTATRLFFMKATMKHLPVAGFHSFKNGNAFMDIRLLSLFRVQYQAGSDMNISETVTFFNDMCCMAPATLIDGRFTWLDADSNKVKAVFTNNNISIAAWLYFNDRGELINFISEDRYAVTANKQMKRFRWATPLKDYQMMNGHKLPAYADLIYTYPEGDFCYGNFKLTGIEYNCTEYK